MLRYNYNIILHKRNKKYAVNCKERVIDVTENKSTHHIVDIDNDTKYMYWINCLNKIRNKWRIIKCERLPDFDIQYIPGIDRMCIKSICTYIPSTPCILIPNLKVYTYDNVTNSIWETNIIQVYFPRYIVEHFKYIDFVIDFVIEDDTVTLLPQSHSVYINIKSRYSSFSLPPFYKHHQQSLISISSYPDMWKYIRFFGKYDIPITSFLQTMHS